MLPTSTSQVFPRGIATFNPYKSVYEDTSDKIESFYDNQQLNVLICDYIMDKALEIMFRGIILEQRGKLFTDSFIVKTHFVKITEKFQ